MRTLNKDEEKLNGLGNWIKVINANLGILNLWGSIFHPAVSRVFDYGVYYLLSNMIYQFIFVFLGHTRVALGSTTEGQNCS